MSNRLSLLFVTASLIVAASGCSSTIDVNIVEHRVCRGVNATVVCPVGVDAEGTNYTFQNGIEGYEPAFCQARRLRLQYNVHPFPAPDFPSTSASIVEILEDEPNTEPFTFVSVPSDFGPNSDVGLDFELVCEDPLVCDEFVANGVETFLTFECQDGSPVVIETSPIFDE